MLVYSWQEDGTSTTTEVYEYMVQYNNQYFYSVSFALDKNDDATLKPLIMNLLNTA